MGSSIAANLKSSNHTVYWVSRGRSLDTQKRAQDAGIAAVADLNEGLAVADMVFSICPPEAALELATNVRGRGFENLYMDANATSPDTALQISDLFGQNYVDGGIIGPPATRPRTTRLYLSGMRRVEVAELFQGTLVGAVPLDEQNSSASALKMCYASYTKGTSALLLALRALAEYHGITEALLSEWSISQPGLEQRSSNTAPGTSRKGWRFTGEMLEISKTYSEAGLPGDFHQAAAEIYRRMTPFKDQEPAQLEQVIEVLLDRKK